MRNEFFENYKELVTETRNEKSMSLDEMSALEVAQLMNRLDAEIPPAVEKALPQIAAAAERIAETYRNGGRLVYCGAGTSGRLGILDAVECFPTFGAGKDMVIARIAGGEKALLEAVEGAEDDAELGRRDMQDISLTEKDILVTISASGSALYCIGALRYAKSIGAQTVGISCVERPAFTSFCDILITTVAGPEILTGSTRLRAGTATKMVLNMLSTISMVRIGKVYKNLMVDMIPTNRKLENRAVRFLTEATGVSPETAAEQLRKCNGNMKAAIVCILTGAEPEKALTVLEASGGFVRKAIAKLL